MKKLFVYLEEYKKEAMLGPLFKLAEAVLELFVPLIVAMIIDNGIGAGDSGYVVKMSLLMVAIGLFGLIISVTAQYFSAKAAIGFGANLKAAMFAKIQRLTFSQTDEIGEATLITRLTSDVNQVQTGLNLALRLLLRSPFIVFGSVIMAFTVDAKSALIFLGSVPILAAIVFFVMLVTIPLYKKVQSRLDIVLRKTRENLTGVRVIRIFGREQKEIEEFHDENEQLAKQQRFVGRIAALTNPLTFVVVNLAIIILIQSGAVRVFDGQMSQGQVVALYNYMSQILVELIKLASLIISINRAIACAKRAGGILELETTDGEHELGDIDSRVGDDVNESEAHSSDNVVEFVNVGMAYSRSSEKALENISFSVKQGETIGIIGGTGSGKSTLVEMIPRFYDVSEGQVLVKGRDVREYSKEELRAFIGLVPQKAVLFKGSLRENMAIAGGGVSDKAIARALELAQGSNIVPEGKSYDDFMIAQGGKNLSGGQRQRLTIARALLRKPEILILDDSASALDQATDAALRKAIKELGTNGDMTVFIVSQRTNSVAEADKIIVLDDGEAVGYGTHAELLESCEVYREIYYSQYPEEEGKKVSEA